MLKSAGADLPGARVRLSTAGTTVESPGEVVRGLTKSRRRPVSGSTILARSLSTSTFIERASVLSGEQIETVVGTPRILPANGLDSSGSSGSSHHLVATTHYLVWSRCSSRGRMPLDQAQAKLIPSGLHMVSPELAPDETLLFLLCDLIAPYDEV